MMLVATEYDLCEMKVVLSSNTYRAKKYIAKATNYKSKSATQRAESQVIRLAQKHGC